MSLNFKIFIFLPSEYSFWNYQSNSKKSVFKHLARRNGPLLMENLSPDIKYCLLPFLNFRDLACMSAVSKQFYHLSADTIHNQRRSLVNDPRLDYTAAFVPSVFPYNAKPRLLHLLSTHYRGSKRAELYEKAAWGIYMSIADPDHICAQHPMLEKIIPAILEMGRHDALAGMAQMSMMHRLDNSIKSHFSCISGIKMSIKNIPFSFGKLPIVGDWLYRKTYEGWEVFASNNVLKFSNDIIDDLKLKGNLVSGDRLIESDQNPYGEIANTIKTMGPVIETPEYYRNKYKGIVMKKFSSGIPFKPDLYRNIPKYYPTTGSKDKKNRYLLLCHTYKVKKSMLDNLVASDKVWFFSKWKHRKDLDKLYIELLELKIDWNTSYKKIAVAVEHFLLNYLSIGETVSNKQKLKRLFNQNKKISSAIIQSWRYISPSDKGWFFNDRNYQINELED